MLQSLPPKTAPSYHCQSRSKCRAQHLQRQGSFRPAPGSMGSRSEQQRNMKSLTEHLVYLVPTCAHLAATTWTATINTKQKSKNCKRKIECPKPNTFGLPHFASKHPLSDHQFISSHGDFFLAKSLDGTHQGEKTSPWQSHRHPWRPWRQNESLNPWTNGSPAPFWHKQCIFREKLYCIFPIFIRIPLDVIYFCVYWVRWANDLQP